MQLMQVMQVNLTGYQNCAGELSSDGEAKTVWWEYPSTSCDEFYTVNEGERRGQQPNKMSACDIIYFHLNTFDNINNCVCVQYSTVVYSTVQ